MSKVKLEHILLGMLLQRPQTGYELQQFMDGSGRFLRANTSMTQVYRSLRSMEQDGWLEHDVEPRHGARDAKRYTVTEHGHAVFLDWLRQPYVPPDRFGDEQFAVHLRFRAQYLGRASVIELLDAEIDFWQQHRSRFRHRDRAESFAADSPIDVEFAGAILNWEHRYGANRVDAHLDAVAQLRATLLADDLPVGDLPNPLTPIDPETHRTETDPREDIA